MFCVPLRPQEARLQLQSSVALEALQAESANAALRGQLEVSDASLRGVTERVGTLERETGALPAPYEREEESVERARNDTHSDLQTCRRE